VLLASSWAMATVSAGGEQVLEKFVGSWRARVTISRSGDGAGEIRHEGRTDCRRTLGGRFVECRTRTTAAGPSELQIMTVDAGDGSLRQWVFDSEGYMHAATGAWNPRTETLTWRGVLDRGPFVIEDRWTSPDRLEWELRRFDAAGAPTPPVTGVLEREGP
jgi:hypothetical protein